jgi:DNA adenine methylase
MLFLDEDCVYSTKNIVTPTVIKWAGGKRQLASTLIPLIIDNLNSNNKYYEPFLGSGAIAFSLNHKNKILSDKNDKLINFYLNVKNNFEELFIEIVKLTNRFNDLQNKQKFYYDTREIYNNIESPGVKQAVLFWFLNKTCFNGMYRETKDGRFNIPYGKRSCPLPDRDIFGALYTRIKDAELSSNDFGCVCNKATVNDVLYCDPPYIPISDTSSFSTYLKNGFDLDEHYRLKNMMSMLSEKGVKVIMSNSDCPKTREIYGDLKGFKIDTVLANRMIAAKSESREAVREVIVSNV